MPRGLFITILIFFSLHARAFGPITPLGLHFKHLGKEDGLTDDRYNYYIFQDSYGFTWISSISGLNRFDGYRVKTYGQESGMFDLNIQGDFFEDPKGDIWFSTYEAINRYDRTKDSIQAFTIYKEPGIPETSLRAIYLDTIRQRLWFRGELHLYWMDICTPGHHERVSGITPSYHFSPIATEPEGLQKIVTCSSDSLKGMEILEMEGDRVKDRHPLLRDWRIISRNLHLEDELWLLIADGELFLFDVEKDPFPRSLSNRLNGTVFDVVKLDADHLLVSTLGLGLWYFNWRENTLLRNWRHNEDISTSLPDNSPRDLYLSPSKYLWASSQNDGVAYAYLLGNEFLQPLAWHEDAPFNVVSLTEDDLGNIWVATEQKGIKVLDQEGRLVKEYDPGIVAGDTSYLQQVVNVEGFGMLATTYDGLYHYSPRRESFQRIPALTSDTLQFWYISPLFPRRVVVSTRTGMWEVVNNGKEDNYVLKRFTELADYTSFQFLDLYQCSHQRIFLPYNSSELWIYEKTPSGMERIEDLDCRLVFYDFFQSRQRPNTLWAGTTGGLVRIEGDTQIVYMLKEFPEFVNTVVHGVIEDRNGRLWLASNKGMWMFDPADSTLIQFEEEDGLPSELFSIQHSALMASDGKIWMGTNEGPIAFHPDEIRPLPHTPSPYIEEVTINNEELPDSLLGAQALAVKYRENTLGFRLNAISYFKPEKSVLRYRLKNYEEDWSSVPSGHLVRFVKVPPGEYTLEYKAVNANGNESRVHELKVLVSTPFWKTWWFYLLSTLIISGLIYRLYRFRTASIRRDEEKKTAIAQLQLKVAELENKALRAQMNPHFLSNALNSIKGIILKNDMKLAATHLTSFSSLIRTILANSDKKLILLEKELDALKLYIELESLRFTQQFTYEIRVDKNVDQGFVRIPPLILQPFVENAIWHGLMPKISGSKKLAINIYRKGDFVICEIEDNGVGREEKPRTHGKAEHRSMGISLTENRIKLLHPENAVTIIDLKNGKGQALGTKVLVQLFSPA